MTKYKTKPKDYTGCHSVIVEYLKRGEAIYCKVWDEGKEGESAQDWVIEFYNKNTYPYETELSAYKNAEPIPIEKRIMPPERAFPILFAAGHYFDGDGDLVDKEGENSLFASNFHYFGKALTGAPTWFEMYPEILEELP